MIISLILNLTIADVINKNLERTLDITSQLVKTTYKLTVEETSGKPIKDYEFIVREPNLSYISVKDGFNKKVEMEENHEDGSNLLKFNLTFSEFSSKQTLLIETVSTKNILAYPSHIKQNDKQLVKFVGSLYLYSKYPTYAQKTNVILSSSNILSHTQAKPFLVSSNKIFLGPYENIESKFSIFA